MVEIDILKFNIQGMAVAWIGIIFNLQYDL